MPPRTGRFPSRTTEKDTRLSRSCSQEYDGVSPPEIVSVTSVDQAGNEKDPNAKDRLVEVYSRAAGPDRPNMAMVDGYFAV